MAGARKRLIEPTLRFFPGLDYYSRRTTVTTLGVNLLSREGKSQTGFIPLIVWLVLRVLSFHGLICETVAIVIFCGATVIRP